MKWITFGAIILAVGFLSSFPFSGMDASGDKRTFRMTLSNEPPTLDWNLATDSVSFTVLINLMEGLTEYDDALRPRPAVARSWDVSPDGKIYHFHIRKDARWSDGKPVTASDFEYSWKRLLDPKTAAEYAYFLYDVEGAEDYNTGKVTRSDSVGVRALDDHTLEVRLNKAVVFFPSITTFMVTFPMRRDVVERYETSWTEPGNIVTNGPFVLESWHHEYKLTLRPNRYYAGGQPAVKAVALYIVNQPSTALTLYETGDLEMANLPPEAMASSFSKPS